MPSISVPFAPGIYKFVAGIPLAVFAVLALSWGAKNLRSAVQMWLGSAPLPVGSSAPFVVAGAVMAALALGVGSFMLFFLVALETTRPTLISEAGISVGQGPPFYRARQIAWPDVRKVTCNLPPRENRIRRITIFSPDATVELGDAGTALDQALALARARAPKGTVRPCEHGALDHSWSY